MLCFGVTIIWTTLKIDVCDVRGFAAGVMEWLLF